MAACACVTWLGSGCEDEDCQLQRQALERTWSDLQLAATSLQQPPVGEDLAESKQEERVRAWNAVATKAELLRSSFATVQITWDPARKARGELQKLWEPLADQEEEAVHSFGLTLQQADERWKQTAAACR